MYISRTSFSRKNYQRKYITCEKPSTEACKRFHQWLPTDHEPQTKDIGNSYSVLVIIGKIDRHSTDVLFNSVQEMSDLGLQVET